MNNILKIVAVLVILNGIFAASDVIAYHDTNNLPVFSQIPARQAQVGQLLQFTVSASDTDNDLLSYYALNLPFGARFDRNSRVFSWIPDRSGNYSVIFRAFDSFNSYIDAGVVIRVDDALPHLNISNGSIATPVVTVSQPAVFPGTTPPITFVSFDPPETVKEGQLYTYTVQAVSPGKTMTYRITQGPQGLTVNKDRGVIFWIPNFSQGGPNPYLVTVGAFNGHWEALRSFYLTVEDVPQPAVIATVIPASSGAAEKTVPVEEKVEEENEKETVPPQTLGATVIGTLGSIFLNPWLLLAVVLILAFLLFQSRKEIKSTKQELRLKKPDLPPVR